MQELKIAVRSIKDELAQHREFHYHLLIEQIELGHFSCENYGIRIEDEAGESTSIPGITTSAERIDELLTLLVEHQVGPAALADVVADWL